MISNYLSNIDEKEIIDLKKNELKDQGIILKIHKKVRKTILTTEGYLKFCRTVLKPIDKESKDKLLELYGCKSIIPLDILLKIDKLKFKITKRMMVEIAYWAVTLNSYDAASIYFKEKNKIDISSDIIRLVTNHIGKIVFDEDVRIAKEMKDILEHRLINLKKNKDGILYMMMDGAMFNTRTKDSHGSTWRENKLCVVFSSDNIHFWKNAKGELEHRILKREYLSYIGKSSDFKYHCFALAYRNGYGEYKQFVIISDGATWIRKIKESIFPHAQQILDLYHLKENVYTFAKAFYSGDETKSKKLALGICNKLENGKWKSVLKFLKIFAKKSSKSPAKKLYIYIFNNRHNIDYPKYRKLGYFVGSGAIESGNRIVLQRRLKLPGMRWNALNAQYVLALKSKLESGLWLTVLKFILKQ